MSTPSRAKTTMSGSTHCVFELTGISGRWRRRDARSAALRRRRRAARCRGSDCRQGGRTANGHALRRSNGWASASRAGCPRGRHPVDRGARADAEEDRAAGPPGAMPMPGAHRRSSRRHRRKVDALQLGVSKERQRAAVRRPEHRVAPSVPGTGRASRSAMARSQTRDLLRVRRRR